MTTPNNNEIISRLLSDAGTSIPESPQLIDTENTSIASARVLSTRYKVYLLIVLLILYIVAMYVFLPALDRYQIEQSSLQNIAMQLQNFENKRLQYVADANFLQKVDEQQEILLNCINNQRACEALDPIVQERRDLAAFFLQFGNVTDPVMGLDEKSILASLNDYALVRTPNSAGVRERNGAIQSIRISDPVVYEGNVYRVPIDMTVQFANKDGLLSFINNIENSLPENPAYRLLYVIDQIDYDVTRYSEEQKATIQLSLFYYPN
jgi:hypothetical protein